ncbi:MAG: hypothetical protein WCW33_03730 [Candidatus Babeliales bacterium]
MKEMMKCLLLVLVFLCNVIEQSNGMVNPLCSFRLSVVKKVNQA